MIKSNLKIYPWRGSLIGGVMAACFTALSPASIQATPATVQATPAAAKVTGEVLDATGEPLIGASVMVKGTSEGVATDIDGRFTLNVPMGATLVVSYVGYKTQEVNVNSDNLVITLADDTAMLDEVVVVGYGTQKKATLTGAVATVGADALANKGNLSSPVQALQGQVPGVIITRNSSAPGDESWNMSLRGAVSKNSASPLIIIDGVEYESVNDLRLINPSDIESMNFLKDAAASIYGSKAAGGVVLITTKQAKGDSKVKVDYNGSYTYKHIGLSAELMSLDEWSTGIITGLYNDYNLGLTTEDPKNNTWYKYATLAKEYRNQWINGNPLNMGNVDDMTFFDTDWQDVMWGDSWSTNHELSVSGGGKNTYRFSLGYMYDDSNLKWGNNNNQRINLRLNNKFTLTDNFTIQSVISYNRQDQVAPTQISGALTVNSQQPGFPTSTIDGKPYGWGNDWATPNWKCELGGDNKLKVNALNISETLRYEILKGFTANAVLGYNHSTATRDTKQLAVDYYQYDGVTPEPIKGQSQSDTYYENSFSTTDFYTVQGYLNWTRSFKEAHNLSLMAGLQYNMKQYQFSKFKAMDIQPELEIINGAGEKSITGANNWEESIMSYYGRANYDYKGKYMIEGQFRYDGSSKFQKDNRWAFFWGTSLGWRISEESFMQPLSPVISNLKLRASYGNVGNQSGIDRYSGVLLWNVSSQGGNLIGGQLVNTLDTNGKLVSTDRTWERVHNYDIGLDFGFLNNRLNGSVDAFWKKTNNMLIDVLYPGILGDKAPTANRGKFKAWGYEGNVTWNDRIGNVNYHIGGTFTYADNELVDNGGSGAKGFGRRSDQEGYPLNSIWGLRYIGKIQNEEQLEKYKARYKNGSTYGTGEGNIDQIRVGDNMYEDVNGDGKLDLDDLVYLGTDDPKIQFSFNGGFEWNGFDFNVVFQGATKRTVYRREQNKADATDPWQIPMRDMYHGGSNQWVGNVWSPETPDGRYPPLTFQDGIRKYNYQPSSWLMSDGTYLRLKNLTIGYTMPESLIKKTRFLSNVRIYVTGTDLWETCKIHDGWDPEAASYVSASARYPFLRTWTFGANLTF
ncbi:MAG: TonB-dependent receptor [Paenibacillus sp.]|nr:TonB-dependent receptor [Paenibacillus sp.]